MAGSSRSLAFNCSVRHSARSRAPTPDRIETLQHAQHRLDILDLAAQAGGDIRQFGAQITGLVHRIDQRQQDHAVFRQQRGDGELAFQVILERGVGGDGGFQAVLAFIGVAGLDRGPVGQGAGLRPFGGSWRRLAVIHIVMRGLVHVGGLGKIVPVQRLVGPLAGGAVCRRLPAFR